VASGGDRTGRDLARESLSVSSATGSQGLTVQSSWGTIELVEALADEWRDLCQEGPCDQPFFRPEWIAAAIAAFAPGRRLSLVTARDRGRLRAVLPLLEEKASLYGFPFTRLRGAANVQHSGRFDLVHGNSPDVQTIARVVWRHLKDSPGWDMVELPIIPQGGAAEQLLTIAEADKFPTFQYEQRRNPYLLLDRNQGGADCSRFAPNAHFRQNLRRRWRKLEAAGSLSLRRADQADQDDLQRFYGLERKGWKGKKGTAIACSRETQQFYDSVAQCGERFGYLSLYFLEQGNAVIAAHFGLTCGGRYFPLKVGYEEDYAEYGPGHLITWAILRDCVQRGLSEFDFLGQWAEWKGEWASDVRPHASGYIFRNNLIGRLLEADTRKRHKLEVTIGRATSIAAALRSNLARRGWLPGHG
jgi:CelD/BcsL family acetyltransferase involved in cellulose biosynthesis